MGCLKKEPTFSVLNYSEVNNALLLSDGYLCLYSATVQLAMCAFNLGIFVNPAPHRWHFNSCLIRCSLELKSTLPPSFIAVSISAKGTYTDRRANRHQQSAEASFIRKSVFSRNFVLITYEKVSRETIPMLFIFQRRRVKVLRYNMEVQMCHRRHLQANSVIEHTTYQQ